MQYSIKEETKPMNIRQKQNLKHKRLKESKNDDETNNANEDERIMENTNNRLNGLMQPNDAMTRDINKQKLN